VGRVVKNAPFSDEAYVVAPPHAGGVNGKATVDESVLESSLQYHEETDSGHVEAPQTPDLDWATIHREVSDLIETATADAEALITDARERVKTIVDSAQAGAAGITEKARAEGRAAGHAEGIDSAEREMDEMLATMRGLIVMARVERHKIIESAEAEIVRLAMGIAERILHKAVEVDREVVVAMTKAAIAQLVDRESVTVRVNPIDLERMKQHRDSVLALGETKHMRVIEDQRVDPGGVVVETATQVEEAKRVLRIEGAEVVPETADGSLHVNGNGPVASGELPQIASA
jgi:flagellar biosynthesis/type III secretory pathway protein FliH